MVMVNYYGVRILAHRAFVSGPRAVSQLHPSSFDVVGEAATETLKVVKSIRKKNQVIACGVSLVCMTFNVGVILLREAWKKKLRSMEYSFEEAKFCLAVCHESERR